MLEYWWVGLIVFAVCCGPTLYHKWKHRNDLHAQFVIPAAIGCVLVIFNSIGIISAVLGIISGLIRLFLWKVGG
jgi:hypothetical protein